jgi:hypothetical protein
MKDECSMPLQDGYIAALEQLGTAFQTYYQRTGHHAVLVGGAATAIYTAGAFPSGDFDIVAANSPAFDEALLQAGFRREDRAGHLLVGFYHPGHPEYGFQQVSGALFDGRADRDRLRVLSTSRGDQLALPSIEDMIADRLAQYAVASPTDDSRLLQARMLVKLADPIDRDYLLRRIHEEGGDPALLEIGDPEAEPWPPRRPR